MSKYIEKITQSFDYDTESAIAVIYVNAEYDANGEITSACADAVENATEELVNAGYEYADEDDYTNTIEFRKSFDTEKYLQSMKNGLTALYRNKQQNVQDSWTDEEIAEVTAEIENCDTVTIADASEACVF